MKEHILEPSLFYYLNNPMSKVYLVTFIIENKKVYKIGITSKPDVQTRFQTLINSGIITDFKIHISRWVKDFTEAKTKEENCFEQIVLNFPENNYIDKEGSHHFHNIWLKEQVSGITEIRKYNHVEYKKAYQLVDQSGYRYIRECS